MFNDSGITDEIRHGLWAECASTASFYENRIVITHIAGRTGRAGKAGSVINVVSNENAGSLKSWEHMLEVQFDRVDIKDVSSLP